MTMAASNIVIRRARVEDAEAFAATMSNPQVLRNLMQLPYGDAAEWRTRLADLLKPGELRLLLVAEIDGAVVGSAGLHPAVGSHRRRHAMGLGISVHPTHWRCGVGSALMSGLLEWADGWAGVLRVELNAFTDNTGAIALYERFGFVAEGTLRGYALRDGRYDDVLTMARWHPAPPALVT